MQCRKTVFPLVGLTFLLSVLSVTDLVDFSPTPNWVFELGDELASLERQYRPGMMGFLIYVTKSRNTRVIVYRPEKVDWGQYFRFKVWPFTWKTFQWTVEAIGQHMPVESVVHFTNGDVDQWYGEVVQGPDCPWGKGIRRIHQTYDALYWTSYSATLMPLDERVSTNNRESQQHSSSSRNESVPARQIRKVEGIGNLGPRSFLVPHDDAGSHCGVVGRTASLFDSERDPSVLWRGSSTGSFPDYSNSDRYKVVKAFTEAIEKNQTKIKISVAFSSVFGNAINIVPPKMAGKRLTVKEMSNTTVAVDIDGNSNAWESLRLKLLSGVPVIKFYPRRFSQWYYPLLRSGENIILLSADDPNLVRKTEEIASNTNLLRKISKEGYAFAQREFSCEGLRSRIHAIVAQVAREKSSDLDWRIQGSGDLASRFPVQRDPIWDSCDKGI